MNISQPEMRIKGLAAEPAGVGALEPTPTEEWERVARYVGFTRADQRAMTQTVEPLFAHGPAVVAETYAYLQRVPETAAILGWEQGADPAHLAERRRFFTIWMARTLGIDLGADFADYLFYAGKVHAGHGPRHIVVAEPWVTGAISLTQSTFARLIADNFHDAQLAVSAIAAWNKYLMIQLDLMLLGYRVARALDDGVFDVRVSFFGRLRDTTGAAARVARASSDATVAGLLRKVLNYYPNIRHQAMETTWRDDANPQSLWPRVEPLYVLQDGWRLLLNGKDLRYYGGYEVQVRADDDLALFPPGR